MSSIPSNSIDISIDLRNIPLKIDAKHSPRAALLGIWREISNNLQGKKVSPGQKMEIASRLGSWNMLVLDADVMSEINENTFINIIDIQREPELRHACQKCTSIGKTSFGPFYCPECRNKELPDRLCELHAQFLENRYTAYCGNHIPFCQCREGCHEIATFECDACRRTYSERWKRHHPNDKFTLLCQNCYSYRFERCEDCEKEGRKRLGKSRCAYPTDNLDERHGKRICTFRHARQWQIWGPHWRGIVLCETHYQQLSKASPSDLLWMLVTAKAPASFLRNKIFDAHRVKNIVSYVRKQELSWAEMEMILNSFSVRATSLKSSRFVHENIENMLRKVSDAKSNAPAIEHNLLGVIRDFYRSYLRSNPDNIILGVTLKRVFGCQGKPQSYRIGVKVARDQDGKPMKGLLIGKGGVLVNQLKEKLRAHSVENVDFEE